MIVRRPVNFCSILLWLMWVALAGGCAHERVIAPARPWVLHLPGIGGERSIDHTLVSALREGGVDADFEIFDWTGNDFGIPALQNHLRHVSEARRIADRITAQYRADPLRTIHLTSHSGGAGMAVWALELLPRDVQVESAWMFAPALSPTYDLSKALGHVRGRLYVFSSPYDLAILSGGTRIFGTIDGIKCDAAGLNGFVMPPGADAGQYRKIAPCPYQLEWAREYGNVGSHICPLRRKFAREYIAVLFRTGRPPNAPTATQASASVVRGR
jgi:hypothetical protein